MSRKGFTLVELMVVILIVAILAAIAIPIMRGKIDAAKWAEGKAMMGTIATAIRAYCAVENKPLLNATDPTLSWEDLGLQPTDFEGTYFKQDSGDGTFDWEVTYIQDTEDLTFWVHANAPTTINLPDDQYLSHQGQWTPDAPTANP